MAITFERRIAFAYPGQQSLHANFFADETGFYFAGGGTIGAVTTAGARNASADITLENLPSTQTVWGFTRLSDQRWAVVTREQLASNTIGTIRIFDADGSADQVKSIPTVLQGFLAERFGNPKSIVEIGDKLYVRVARPGVTGRLRFLRFDLNGNVENADITLDQTSPTALSDMASNGEDNLIVIQQVERRAYIADVPGFTIDTSETMDLDSRNTGPFAASATAENLYVADRVAPNFIYEYSGIGVPKPPAPTMGGQGGPGIMQMAVLDAMLARDMRNRRDR